MVYCFIMINQTVSCFKGSFTNVTFMMTILDMFLQINLDFKCLIVIAQITFERMKNVNVIVQNKFAQKIAIGFIIKTIRTLETFIFKHQICHVFEMAN